MLPARLPGIYSRGNCFWFTYRLNGKKHFHIPGTSDYGAAVQKALAIRQTPELAPGAVFAAEIAAFIAHDWRRPAAMPTPPAPPPPI